MVNVPRLAVADATVRFGDRAALVGFGLEVATAEVVAVLGPSGSGKSTLLRAVAGLQRLDAGTVRVDGRDLAGVPVHRRGVGLMFQQHALFPHRDVAGNVGFGLRTAGLGPSAIRQRVAELLAMVGLPGAENRAVADLSGGEQQRVALARALAPSPSVLLLDEPLGALDRGLRDHLVAELRGLFTDHGLTVVAVTHDQAEAFALADRIAVVDEGRLLQEGPPASVWRAPGSRRVAELLGFTNVVDGEVRQGVARTVWGELPVGGRADGPAAIVVRPEGVSLGGGPLGAVVRAVVFRGADSVVDLELAEGPPMRAEVPSAGAPARGARVQVAIDPSSVVAVDVDG